MSNRFHCSSSSSSSSSLSSSLRKKYVFKISSFDSRRLGYSVDEGTHSVIFVSQMGFFSFIYVYVCILSCACISVCVFSEL